MKKHLIIATYDGIGTHYSGVGTIAKNIVNALIDLDDSNLKVSVAYVNVDKQSKIFNEQCYKDSLKLVNKTSGNLIPLCNNTLGQSEWDMWRSFPEWDITCTSLVTALNIVLKNDEENTIILNDTPFLMFAKYRQMVNNKNLKCFYFPLSTGMNHAFGNDDWRKERVKREKECFELIKHDQNSKIISLGKNFAARMSEDYGLNFTEDNYLQNGLCFDKYDNFLNKNFTNDDLSQFGIKIEPENKIVFAWGRCSVAKGFRELAQAWLKCSEKLTNHHLILQMPNNSGEADYFREIKEILNIPRVTIIDDFNPNIWKTILRNKNTDVVCIPSLMDPFPHTSIEAKLFSKGMNYVTVISSVDGAVDAFEQNESIYVDPRNTELFAEKIIEAAVMIPENRRVIIDRNEETIEKFDFLSILQDFIKNNIIEKSHGF